MTAEQLGELSILATFDTEGCRDSGESLHAVRIRNGETAGHGVYRITSVPVMVEMHKGDLVLCDESDPDRVPLITACVLRSDEVTLYMQFTKRRLNKAPRVIAALTEAGAYVQETTHNFFAISVPVGLQREVELVLEDQAPYLHWWQDKDQDQH